MEKNVFFFKYYQVFILIHSVLPVSRRVVLRSSAVLVELCNNSYCCCNQGRKIQYWCLKNLPHFWQLILKKILTTVPPHAFYSMLGYYCYFTELRQWVSLCLHFVKISSFWFKSVFWSLCNMILVFSVKQRSQHLPPRENA